MKLYYDGLSGHSHRVRLFFSLIGQPVEIIETSLFKGEHKTPEFLSLNPFGQLPVLADDGFVLADSNAILVYVAKKLGAASWLPDDAADAARVQRWLSIAAGEIAYGPSAARLVTLFGAPLDAAAAIGISKTILARIDAELDQRDWIALSHPTIADVALYSYVAAAPEGNVDTSHYANIQAWLQRVEALPGFIAFEPNSVGLRAVA